MISYDILSVARLEIRCVLCAYLYMFMSAISHIIMYRDKSKVKTEISVVLLIREAAIISISV